MEHPIDVLGISTYMNTHEFFQSFMQVNVSQSQQSHMGCTAGKSCSPSKVPCCMSRGDVSKAFFLFMANLTTQKPSRLSNSPAFGATWRLSYLSRVQYQHSMATGWFLGILSTGLLYTLYFTLIVRVSKASLLSETFITSLIIDIAIE